MKKRKIKEAMTGRMVWCRNASYALEATPCEQVSCPYKNDETRLARARELKDCHTFQITELAQSWNAAVHVLPKPYR